MNRTYINEVQKEIGNTVKVQGFIENLRNSKYMAFIVLKDITGKLQITVEKADPVVVNVPPMKRVPMLATRTANGDLVITATQSVSSSKIVITIKNSNFNEYWTQVS